MQTKVRLILDINRLEVEMGWNKSPRSHFETYTITELKEHLRELKKSVKGKK